MICLWEEMLCRRDLGARVMAQTPTGAITFITTCACATVSDSKATLHCRSFIRNYWVRQATCKEVACNRKKVYLHWTVSVLRQFHDFVDWSSFNSPDYILLEGRVTQVQDILEPGGKTKS